MPTSLHVPKPILDAVDRRARQLKVSRNRFIVRALEKELSRTTQWSPGFFEELARVERGDREAIDEMLTSIRANRRSKKPGQL